MKMLFSLRAVSVTLLAVCGILLGTGAAQAQQRAAIPVGGPCVKCADHMLGIVRSIDGVREASFDAANSMLSVAFDQGTSALDIAIELSLAGYDAGDFRRDAKAQLPPCCQATTRGDAVVTPTDKEEPLEDDLEDEDLGNWEDPANLEELDRLAPNHDPADGITDEDLEDEEEDDSDLKEIVGEEPEEKIIEEDEDDEEGDDEGTYQP